METNQFIMIFFLSYFPKDNRPVWKGAKNDDNIDLREKRKNLTCEYARQEWNFINE